MYSGAEVSGTFIVERINITINNKNEKDFVIFNLKFIFYFKYFKNLFSGVKINFVFLFKEFS